MSKNGTLMLIVSYMVIVIFIFKFIGVVTVIDFVSTPLIIKAYVLLGAIALTLAVWFALGVILGIIIVLSERHLVDGMWSLRR